MGNLSPKMQVILKTLARVALAILLIVLFVTRVLGYVAPFIVAFLIMIIIEKPAQLLEKRLRFPRGIAVAVTLVGFVALFGGAIVFVFYKIINELWRLAQEIPKMDVQPIINFFQNLMDRGQSFYFSLPEGLTNTIRQTLDANIPKVQDILSRVSSELMKAVTYMVGIVVSLPQVLIFIVISMAAAYFMSRDRKKISTFIYKQLPPSWGNKIRFIKNDMVMAFIGFIKAQAILMCITFLELLIGYLILNVKYAFFFALVTAIVDILPVLGTGTVLIPTAIFYLITGNLARAFGFIVLYLVITVIRQSIEPRIVGHSLGLHPLVTLMSMYIGLQLFGVVGMLLGPVVVIVLKTLQKAKVLPSWKT